MTPRARTMAEIEEIAASHGFTLAEIVRPDRRPALAVARREMMVHLRLKGFTFPQIGTIMRRNHSTVIAAIRRAGLPRDCQPELERQLNKRDRLLAEAYISGEHAQEIAKRFEVSTKTLYAAVARFELPMRSEVRP